MLRIYPGLSVKIEIIEGLIFLTGGVDSNVHLLNYFAARERGG
jgi:hypothetical protein